MGRIVIVYGIIGGLIVAALSQLSMRLLDHDVGLKGMVVGYLSMLVGMSMVLVGVKQYRDQRLGGVIGFWRAFGVGLAIAALASLFYVINWEIYMAATGSDFMTGYAQTVVEKARAAGKSAAEIKALSDQMAAAVADYRQPFKRYLMTLSEIAPVALLVPLVSAALLRNPRFLPAREPIGARA